MLDPGSLAESQARERAEGDERPEPLVGHGNVLPNLLRGGDRHRGVGATTPGEAYAVGRVGGDHCSWWFSWWADPRRGQQIPLLLHQVCEQHRALTDGHIPLNDAR